jgi:putative SbcD/Mre11-related phosphoesterase
MTLLPHPSGALWVPDSRAVVIADAHLGYGWAQRRRGELGPVRDSQSPAKLTAVIDELQPSEVVFLGDLVHAPNPATEERAFIERTLKEVAARARITVVRGNHDRAFVRDFGALGFVSVPAWRCGELTGIHGDRPYLAQPGEMVIAGHLHPSLTIQDAAGVRQRIRVFLSGEALMILPAFSPFAAGLDLSRGIPPKLAAWVQGRNIEVIAATGTRTLNLGPLSRLVKDAAARR